MKPVSSTNRKLRVLLTDIRVGKLIPQPEFQRRVVWTNIDKLNFLDTVLKGYPFPEIYIAAGDVDTLTGEGTELLVDGQQRLTTLNQYFTASPDLKLGENMVPYAQLSDKARRAFLDYDVVVRDLGLVSIEEIKEVFQRINATKYPLNPMEIHNSSFHGAFKHFGTAVASHPFFTRYRVFTALDARRMGDIRFALTFIITIMSTYFNRDEELENYLLEYNDEFEMKDEIERKINDIFQFIVACDLGHNSRLRHKADLLTLLVETHRALIKKQLPLDPGKVGEMLRQFYYEVSRYKTLDRVTFLLLDLEAYYTASRQATNDRSSRIQRGAIMERLLEGTVTQ